MNPKEGTRANAGIDFNDKDKTQHTSHQSQAESPAPHGRGCGCFEEGRRAGGRSRAPRSGDPAR